MQALFDRLAAVSLAAKVGALVGAIVVLCGGYYYLFYSDMVDEEEELQHQAEKLNKEKAEYEKRKREYLAFVNEVNQLLGERKDLLRALPSDDDIEQFIENVQAQVELAGLQKVASVRDNPQPVDIYVKIPVRMSVVGSYHQINHFFKNVGDLRRIVNIEDLSLQPVQDAAGDKNLAFSPSTLLAAKFTATTFRLPEKGKTATGAPKPQGTQITSGGAH